MDNPPPTSSSGVDVAKTGRMSVTEIQTPVPDTAAHLTGELGSQVANAVNVNAARVPEIGTTKEFHSSIVLGIAATTLTKPVVKTGGNTSPSKILQAMTNQMVCANDSDAEKVHLRRRKTERSRSLIEKSKLNRDAIGKMVMYTGMLEELKNLQVDHPIGSIKRIDECLLKLEKHGFNVREPRSRIAKLLVIKERQTRTLEEFKAVEEKITESDNRRRKYEEDIVELQTEFQRREAVLKEAKVKLDTEIARMQSDAVDLDHKVQTVDQDFRAIVNGPW